MKYTVIIEGEMKIFIRAYYRTKWWIMFDVLKRFTYSPANE